MIWTVLAPGPSLKQVSLKHLEGGGPVVAINMAVLSPLHKDFWSCQDPARKFENVWQPLSLEERFSLPLVWCRGRSSLEWNNAGIRTWAHPDKEAEFREAFLPGGVKETHTTNLTILSTISRCIGHGAKKIILYRCDMVGVGYSFGVDSSNRNNAQWSSRWSNEPNTFQKMAKEWASRGVEIDRRSPPFD